MPHLRLPTVDVHASFVEAMAEYRAEGAAEDTIVGGGFPWDTPEEFARLVATLHSDAVTPRQPEWVRYTTWWWCDGPAYLGRIALRHELTDFLRTHGGHIGYDVRPSARRQGHATAMLAAVLPHARALGLAEVMLTCDADNVASRRVIEANGGELGETPPGRCHYWIRL